MPVPLIALLAASIHQVRAADADPSGLDRALSLLARAAGGTPVTLEADEGRLLVNDLPVDRDAPGASLILQALADHDTSRIELPGSLEARHWREVAELFASAPGLYPSAREVRDTLQSALPTAELRGVDRQPMGASLREALHELPDLTIVGLADPAAHPDLGLSTSGADRAEFSARLDPLLHEGHAAVDAKAWERVANVLLQLRELEDQSDDATRSIIARERRRITPPAVIEMLVRLHARGETSPTVARAIVTMGRDGAEALIEALNGSSSRTDRRTYMEALAVARDAEPVIVTALSSHRPELVRDAAEVAGRRRLESALPALAHLLKHSNEQVRTAAWHALERIGTKEAFEVLHKGR